MSIKNFNVVRADPVYAETLSGVKAVQGVAVECALGQNKMQRLVVPLEVALLLAANIVAAVERVVGAPVVLERLNHE